MVRRGEGRGGEDIAATSRMVCTTSRLGAIVTQACPCPPGPILTYMVRIRPKIVRIWSSIRGLWGGIVEERSKGNQDQKSFLKTYGNTTKPSC